MSTRIVICGCGTTGVHVARILAEVHEVTVVDREPAGFAGLPDGVQRVHGDAADPAVLASAGAQAADAVIAVTGPDATNVLIATLAKHRFGARRVVARASDPGHAWLFTVAAGVDVVASGADLVARLVQEEVTAGDLVTVLRLRGGGVAVTETLLPPGAASAGRRVDELAIPAGTAVAAVIRAGEVLLAERAGRLRAGDTVVALCEPGREHVLHRLLVGAEA